MSRIKIKMQKKHKKLSDLENFEHPKNDAFVLRQKFEHEYTNLILN